MSLGKAVGNAVNRLSHLRDLLQARAPKPVPPDMDPEFVPLYERTREFTMTPVEAMYAVYKATEYVVKNRIAGDLVECGVWRGGSSMLAALTLLAHGDSKRTLHLYDTYAGMTEPSDKDREISSDSPTHDRWEKSLRGDVNLWCYASLETVRENMSSTGYPLDRIELVQGKVEDTLPGHLPERIALLRLDTDWFSSTYHELTHLFPRLVSGGILIVDDYSQWAGAREAVDRYLEESAIPIFLNRIPSGGCLAVKQTEVTRERRAD